VFKIMDIKVVKIGDDNYPKKLLGIGNPPEELYYLGKWDDDIFDNCLAVVGSRRMTDYGEKITTKLVSEIACSGVTIVSGFMYGIDATAHKATVDVGGRTIAVMPCGVDVVHPAHQKKLYEKILGKNGLIISEYPEGSPPAKWTYVQRNRIVSGLSDATLVVQAGRKSGSLITADLAKKQKRKVFAVPGPLTSSVSLGTADLIKGGASIVTDSKDVIKSQKSKVKSQNCKLKLKTFTKMGEVEQKIVKELEVDSLTVDELSQKLKISVSEVSVLLSQMELKGVIDKEGNKYCVN
jgi:DNA processing protein